MGTSRSARGEGVDGHAVRFRRRPIDHTRVAYDPNPCAIRRIANTVDLAVVAEVSRHLVRLRTVLSVVMDRIFGVIVGDNARTCPFVQVLRPDTHQRVTRVCTDNVLILHHKILVSVSAPSVAVFAGHRQHGLVDDHWAEGLSLGDRIGWALHHAAHDRLGRGRGYRTHLLR